MSKQITDNLILKTQPYEDSSLVDMSKIFKASGFDYVVGTLADYQAGLATHTSVQAAITAAAADSSIKILKGTYTETITLNKTLYIQGQGHGTVLNGTFTIGATGLYCGIRDLKFGNALSLNASATGNIIIGCWQANGFTITEGTPSSNIIDVWQE